MLTFSSDQWVIVALIFILGLLIGAFLASGGGRKWKHRYNAEVARRRELETAHAQREKDWREQDALRTAALRNPGPARDTVLERDDRTLRREDEIGRDRDRDGRPL